MNNQHRLIDGYRDFQQEIVEKINEIKGIGNSQVKPLIDRIAAFHADEARQIVQCAHIDERNVTPAEMRLIDEGGRCRAQAEEHFRLGFMMLIRSVARPTTEY